VADRNNQRIQIFDLDGNFITQWTHLGSPYGLWITDDDRLYIADGVFERVWIVNAETGDLLDTIEYTRDIHWVAVDDDDNVYAASNQSHYLRKYSRTAASAMP
jgi:DNA-binding beta-propeller fold protein YncE